MNRDQVFQQLTSALLDMDEPSVYFRKLRISGELDEWFPELKALIGVPQNQLHHQEGDAWVHTMMVVDEAAKRRDIAVKPLWLMMAALCHDFGKALCTAEKDGVYHAYRHEELGLPEIERFLSRLGCEEPMCEYVLNLAENHMKPNVAANCRSKIKVTNSLFYHSAEPFDLIQLAICDGLGKIPSCNTTEDFLMERYQVFREMMARPFVTRDDLINSGISDPEVLEKTLEYALKLRFVGCERENILVQCTGFARSMKRK